jgi:hypothetical protein
MQAKQNTLPITLEDDILDTSSSKAVYCVNITEKTAGNKT